MNKEDHLDRAIGSLEGIKRAKAPEGAFKGIQQKLADQRREQQKPQRSWLSIAAVILVVILSNVFVVFNYDYEDQSMSSQETYLQLTSDFNFYENE